MPVYEYVCSNCGHRTDILQGVSDAAPRYCPSCGADGTLRKRFAPPTIVFKGSGWAKKERRSAARSAAGTSSEGGAGEAKADKVDKADKPAGSPSTPSSSGDSGPRGGSTSGGDD